MNKTSICHVGKGNAQVTSFCSHKTEMFFKQSRGGNHYPRQAAFTYSSRI